MSGQLHRLPNSPGDRASAGTFVWPMPSGDCDDMQSRARVARTRELFVGIGYKGV